MEVQTGQPPPEPTKPIEVKGPLTGTSWGKTTAELFSGANKSPDEAATAFGKIGRDISGLLLSADVKAGETPAQAALKGLLREYVGDRVKGPFPTMQGIAEGGSQSVQAWTQQEATAFVDNLGSSGVITEQGAKTLKEELNLQQPPSTATS